MERNNWEDEELDVSDCVGQVDISLIQSDIIGFGFIRLAGISLKFIYLFEASLFCFLLFVVAKV